MMHLTRPQGLTSLPSEAAAPARAARDVGVRVGFAVSMRDRNPLVYGSSEPILAALPADARQAIESIMRTPLAAKDFIALVDEVAAAAAGPLFDVQFGPNGVQWCSDALLAAVADASQRSGRRINTTFWKRGIRGHGPTRCTPQAWSSTSMPLACCRHGSPSLIAFGRARTSSNCWPSAA